MTYQEIRKNEEVLAYIRKGNADLGVLGYTDHSEAHTVLVAERAAFILEQFGYSEQDKELARIAGFMHDIGNVINRKNHAEYGGILANDILKNTDMPIQEIIETVGYNNEGFFRKIFNNMYDMIPNEYRKAKKK